MLVGSPLIRRWRGGIDGVKAKPFGRAARGLDTAAPPRPERRGGNLKKKVLDGLSLVASWAKRTVLLPVAPAVTGSHSGIVSLARIA